MIPACTLLTRAVLSGLNPAGKLSLQPETLRAGQEAKNDLKHFEKRPRRGPADPAGRNLSKIEQASKDAMWELTRR